MSRIHVSSLISICLCPDVSECVYKKIRYFRPVPLGRLRIVTLWLAVET